MPIKFVGFTIGGLIDETIYYVAKIVNDTDFSVKDENGAVITLSDATIGFQTLNCYVGEVVNTAILTVNYPGILNVTATQSGTNILTVPISEIGTGGTAGFYTNLPVFFTGNVFGGIVENDPYYITTVIDNENFTISTTENPLTVTVTQTIASTDTIVMSSTAGFNVNDSVIFTGTTFGNIVAGSVYYVREIVSSTQLTLATAVNGSLFALSDDTGTMSIVSQKDTVDLTTATGTMTMNVSLPVSPGQVNGQLFTLYNTSGQYPGINNGEISDLIERNVTATINCTNVPPYGDGLNRVALSQTSGGTDNFYVNMPFTVSNTIGLNLIGGTTYYVSEYSGETIPDPFNPGEFIARPNIEVTVLSTTTGDELICSTIDTPTPTDTLYVNMPITFTGTGLGGIVIGQEYYVRSIVSSTRFTIKETLSSSSPVDLEADSGTMQGTGDPYIVVVDSPGGTEVVLTDEVPTGVTLNQEILSTPSFDISYILGGYRVIIEDGGEGFAINNTITISGTEVGGTSPANDITLTVNDIDADVNGAITDVIVSGTVPSQSSQYYLKVISPNQFAVYSDPLMEVPVSGIDFGFVGFTTSNVTNVNSTNDRFTIADTSIFEVNDAVVFTGNTQPLITNVTAGTTYYIYDIPNSTQFRICTTPGDVSTIVNIVTTIAVDFTMAKAGSFAFLPEPFYFTPSIVKYLGRVWVCVVSNNDDEFILGKWEELRSGDRRLNALDRVIGYYQPTVNMPGVDLTQLFEGIIYPNSIYQGNAFEPDQQYDVDILLQDQEFYPTDVDLTSVVYDGDKYIAPANLPNYSSVLGSIDNDNWVIGKVTNASIGITDIIYEGGYYVMTTTNSATPIFKSLDAVEWSTSGYFIPYETSPFDPDITLSSASLALNTVGYYSNAYVAGGDNIIRSTDGYVWTQVTNFNSTYNYQIFDVKPIATQDFTGFAAVGKGKVPDYSTGLTELLDTNILFYSLDFGLNWIQVNSLTYNGFNALASDGNAAVAVGEEGAIYYTLNGGDWLGITEAGIISVNSVTEQINVTSTAGFAVNDAIVFTTSFSDIVAGTVYYIKTIDSPTQIKISNTLGGSVKTLSEASTIPVQSLVRLYDAADPTPATLRDVIHANSVWIAIGDDGTVKTSSDYLTWTKQTTGTTESLKGITYNSDTMTFTVVGDNNSIISSDDNGVTWNNVSSLTVDPAIYTVQGAPFEFGYGPEELVPGLIEDDLAMIVTTKPGTNWPVVEYGHTGFGVASAELTPESSTQTLYSFNNIVEFPTQLTVQVINTVTNLATTLSENDYTVDWVSKTITLDTPLSTVPLEKLRVEVYEAGNGNQLVKSSTDIDPIRQNSLSGFDEIYLNCNYSAPAFEGSGVIRPGTGPVEVEITATNGDTNRLTCANVDNFVLNSSITFQGTVFGNIQEDTPYYVKSISTSTNTITISSSYDTISGLAGPTFSLTTATGTMYATINNGYGLVWADPLIYHNGTRLTLGTSGLVTKSSSTTNAFTTTTTSGMVVNERIMFGDDIFDENITPMTTYYVKQIIDNNEFTVSATLGGPVVALTDSFGGSRFITNDFAFGVQPNNIQAKIIFANDTYENGQDYLVYSILGEATPYTYGYSNPEVQEFTGNGSINTFVLNNFCGGDNPQNAVVELNGLRLLSSQYVINPTTNTLSLFSTPSNGDYIRVTTFNDTDQQYLTTQFGITNNPGTAIATVTIGSTRHTEILFDDLASPTGSLPTVSGDFVVGQTYVIQTVGTTDFTLIGASSNTVGVIFVATGPGTGTGTAAVPYDAPSQIPAITYDADELQIGGVYEIASFGTTDWNDVAGTSSHTYSLGDIITVVNAGTGTGTATSVDSAYDESLNWLELSSGTTSLLNVGDSIVFTGSPVFGGIVQGKTYYITEIWSSTEFVISEVPGGSPVVLTEATGTMYGNTNPFVVTEIAYINNTISQPIAQTAATNTNITGNVITVLSTANFVEDQTVSFKGAPVFGGITAGEIYFVENIIDATSFTIKDASGTQVPLTTASGTMVVTVGGTPTTTITTTTATEYELNTRVRLDGILGSTQLNGNAYYVRPINDTTFEIYLTPYQSGLTDNNTPVTNISNYTGGGYVWEQGILFLVSAYITDTTTSTNVITTESTANLVANTPIYFSKAGEENGSDILGGLIQGTKYFVKDIINATEFTVSEEQYGAAFVLTTDSGYINATQWNQENIDRVWTTVNGYRVPSSHLRLYDYNELGILIPIAPGNSIIITNMIPTATPNQEIYINFVNQAGEGSVYRENISNRTYLAQPIYDLSTEIYVQDVNAVTDQIVQNVTTSSAIDGTYNFGLTANRNLILAVQVYNNSTGDFIDQEFYSVVLEDLAPILKIQAGSYINVGDELIITTIEGGTILVNGEQINFGSVNLTNNTLGNLQRGANGTAKQFLIPEYTTVYGLLSANKLRDTYYNQTWNPIPGIYNPILGDPLQIAITEPALFLQSDTDE